MIFRPRVPLIRIVLSLALAVGLSSCAPGAGPVPSAGDSELTRLVREARAAMRAGQLIDAGRTLDEAVRIAPGNPELWVEIARLRFRGGEHLGALEAADRALALGPEFAPALVLKGQLVRDAHGFADALPWFEAALQAQPDNLEARLEYTAALGDMGQNRAMLASARALTSLAPDEPRAKYLQAVLAARGGKPVLARSLLARSGMVERGVASAVLLDAVVSLEQGDYASAIATLEPLAVRQPANQRVTAMLARALLMNGEADAVVARFDSAASRADASPYMLTLVARAHEQEGNRARAAMLLTRAATPPAGKAQVLDDMPGLAAPTAELRRLAETGDWSATDVAARVLRARFPASADIAALAADAALGQGDGARALEQYAGASAVRRPWSLTRRALAAYRMIGDDEAADTLLARHVAGEPGNLDALILLARRRAEQGDWLRTAVLLDHVVALGGGHDPMVLELLRDAASAQGKTDEAATFTTLLRELRPTPLTAG